MTITKKHKYKTFSRITTRFIDDLRTNSFILLFAYNGTGKTRLSMDFKQKNRKNKNADPHTLYYNAYTEDLFHWDNNLKNDAEPFLQMNNDSTFIQGIKDLAIDATIEKYFFRYIESIKFELDIIKWRINFYDVNEVREDGQKDQELGQKEDKTFIKISRGEETIFIWCLFLAICELAIYAEEGSPYDWVKNIYIDDPISSLDDNNVISVACDLANLLKKINGTEKKAIISSHHALFYNIMCNELKKYNTIQYFMHYNKKILTYTLQKTDDTPFFHHVATLHDLSNAIKSKNLYAYHFNILRNVLEKTAIFFGKDDFSNCLHGIDKDDEILYARALNLLSHSGYSMFEPKEMLSENKRIFEEIFNAFIKEYKFKIPTLE